jgi:1-acyl-sn-glycerol-3-phosphate acyltransferase
MCQEAAHDPGQSRCARQGDGRSLQRTKEELATGRQLIIYPEGTRRPPGAEPEYKYGIARMYRDLKLPVVPVAMHPGLFWPRRKHHALSRPFQGPHPAADRGRAWIRTRSSPI